eukprot:UN07830
MCFIYFVILQQQPRFPLNIRFSIPTTHIHTNNNIAYIIFIHQSIQIASILGLTYNSTTYYFVFLFNSFHVCSYPAFAVSDRPIFAVSDR